MIPNVSPSLCTSYQPKITSAWLYSLRTTITLVWDDESFFKYRSGWMIVNRSLVWGILLFLTLFQVVVWHLMQLLRSVIIMLNDNN